MARNPRSGGFTLVEAMVVVVTLGLLLAVAIPNFTNSNARRRAEAAAGEISTSLQIARQRAIATRVPFRLVFDEAEETYWTERSENDSTWVMDPAEEHTLPTGVEWTATAGGDLENTDVEFESRGTVRATDAPFVVTFTSAQNDTFTVSLVRTGRLTVREGEQ